MFDDATRLFGLPPGVDFPAALITGLDQRLADQPPEALAQVEIYVNTDRMRRRLRALYDAGPARLLPRIRLVTDLADPLMAAALPQPIPALRRRLDLVHPVARLLEQAPDLAPRAARYDLADSLATLLEEMQTEGIAPHAIETLNAADQSGHWQRALAFLRIILAYLASDQAPDKAGWQRLALQARLAAWQADPPRHPVIVAGSTASRGTTLELMQAVAGLPQGALVLPGFDFEMGRTEAGRAAWAQLDDPLTGEDHPQFRFARLFRALGAGPETVQPWTAQPAPNPARNRLISLALRPAPVTHQWLSEGPDLPPLPEATADITLLEAPSPRDEAQAIALRLRKAAQEGQSAALITPDRMLSRQVAAALDRWAITADDSAGVPLHLTPPGRFLRHVAGLLAGPLSAETLLTLLKHPLTASGSERGPHLRLTRELELRVRRKSWAWPRAETVTDWAAPLDAGWAGWLAGLFHHDIDGEQPLDQWVATHLALAERIAQGPGTDPHGLWSENAGRTAHEVMHELQAESPYGGAMSARDYGDLLYALLARAEVRDRDAGHPLIRILGTLEARGGGSDLVILGGLNEGSWPESPAADPWLNRVMRAEVGLLLPERRIGLSAHDFQQAAGAPEIWLSRAVKSAEAETVPARWLNRLTNLMKGLPMRQGPEALTAMADRGGHWLALARAAEAPVVTPPARRPSPAPPPEARPRELAVTEVKHLIRDPYAVYAKRVLGLYPLDPLMRAPDAMLRGILSHEVLERFVRAATADPATLTPKALMDVARQILWDPDKLSIPSTRLVWQARLARIAARFVADETQRQRRARPAHFEISGRLAVADLGVTLRGTADRIDIDPTGGAVIYDYKTGSAPTGPQQKHFDKQLQLEAIMALRGAFENLAPRHIAGAEYVSLSPTDPKVTPADLDDPGLDQTWAEFCQLVAAYLQVDRGFTARRAMFALDQVSDYDHLSRLGEWDITDLAEAEAMA